ncbi:hypothetical protein CQA44_10990 [Helicobacter sp. MIT 14-3879]|nr:hypothetical protein CQA44_10990 [Helicobacter sp. MIT 14-3879]
MLAIRKRKEDSSQIKRKTRILLIQDIIPRHHSLFSKVLWLLHILNKLLVSNQMLLLNPNALSA